MKDIPGSLEWERIDDKRASRIALYHEGAITDATEKLARWFDAQWNDKWCIDISDELVAIIEQSWAREEIIPPYHIYVKIAYHLAQEARYGLSEFRIPPEFGNKLFEYQTAAVKIAAHHLNKRNGVLIGDVVGLGKTLMATALAKVRLCQPDADSPVNVPDASSPPEAVQSEPVCVPVFCEPL